MRKLLIFCIVSLLSLSFIGCERKNGETKPEELLRQNQDNIYVACFGNDPVDEILSFTTIQVSKNCFDDNFFDREFRFIIISREIAQETASKSLIDNYKSYIESGFCMIAMYDNSDTTHNFAVTYYQGEFAINSRNSVSNTTTAVSDIVKTEMYLYLQPYCEIIY